MTVPVPVRDREEEPLVGAASLASRLGLRSEAGEDGADLLTLTSRTRGEPEPVGRARRYRAEAGGAGPDRGVELISLVISLPILGLGVERLYGFASPSSAVPHLVVDVRRTGQASVTTLTVDLLPRVDLAVNPAYVELVYGPLDAVIEGARRSASEAEDVLVTSSEMPRRGRVMASPWSTTVALSGASAPRGDDPLTRAYQRRWQALLGAEAEEDDLGLELLRPSPIDRDRRLREGLAAGRHDPLWEDLRRLCGDAQASAAQALVRGG